MYHELAPPPAMRGVVACSWHRQPDDDGPFVVLPDGCVDLVWRSDGRVFVAGPDRGPHVHVHPPASSFDGVRLLPGRAASVLGVAAHELVDSLVDLRDLWADRADRLVEDLSAATSSQQRQTLLTAAVGERLAAGAELDRLVAAAVAALDDGEPVAAIADRFGVSERQLRRRVVHQVGYGPKLLAGVLRFRRFLELRHLVAAGAHTLAWTAAAAGYADQAHLVRDCHRLADATPSELVRFVQDGNPAPGAR
ncbi:MAG TPA: DUF6597 domain-containing transcriptional factor [Acidimicrobiales bacterium]